MNWQSACVAAFLTLFFAAPAFAQTPSGGLRIPDRSVATTERATAIDTNPAGLASMRELELGFGYVAPTQSQDGVTPEGYGGYIGAGIGVFGVGFSAQRLKVPELGSTRQDFTKFSTGVAAGLPFGRVARLNLGLAFHSFQSADDQRFDELSSVQFGAQLRLGEHIALGFNGRDINRPFLYEGTALPAEYEATAGLRFWDGRILFDTGSRSYVGASDVDILTRLAVEPFGGLRFFAHAEFGVVDETDSASGTFDTLVVGTELSLGSTGFEFGTNFDRRTGDTPGWASVGGYVWASSAPKKRSLLEGSQGWVSYNLAVSITETKQSGLFTASSTAFSEIVTDFEAMATDEAVSGVLIRLGGTPVGYAQAWELRQAIQRLRDNGKQSVAFIPQGTLRDYYIGSAADEIWISPTNAFQPGGLRTQFITAAGALRKAGVEAQFVRIGDYKSAPELTVRDTPSDAAREQREAYLDDFYNEVVDGISKGRGLERNVVEGLLESGAILPDEALEKKFVDRIVYGDELDQAFEDMIGRRVSFSKGYKRPRTLEAYWRDRPEIAVVVVEGLIVQLDGANPLTGGIAAESSRLEPLLESLTKNPNVKAIVVRIDSGGGSAYASDVIYRALRRAAARKPVIASMGNSAASGGYYVAAGADTIVATPTTVTGSIGVFSGKFNFKKLASRLGISIESLERGTSVRYDDFYEPWTEKELESVGRSISYLYQLFLTQMAATRPLSADEIDTVARGRVWTGKAARENKLVDVEGGLLTAIRLAEQKAGLEAGASDFSVYPEESFIGGVTDSEVTEAAARFGWKPEPVVANPTDGLIGALLAELERALLLPLLRVGAEPMMMPFEQPVIR